MCNMKFRPLPVVGCEFGFRTPTVLPVNSVDPLRQQKWNSKTLNFCFIMLTLYDLMCVLIRILVDKFEDTTCVNKGLPDDGTRECRNM